MNSLIQAQRKGDCFERVLEHEMEPLIQSNDWLLLPNVHLQSRVGYGQIDFLLFTPTKYLCIEAKGWECEVYCEDKEFWKISYPSRTIKVLSPIKQNITHIGHLSKIIPYYKIESAVCFGNGTTLKGEVEGVYSISKLLDRLQELANYEFDSDDHKRRLVEIMSNDYLKVAAKDAECQFMELGGMKKW